MDTDHPALIAKTLGEIEDRLHTIQNDYAQHTAWIKRREAFLETYEATLYEMVEGSANPTERKVLAKAMLHQAAEYEEYLARLETRTALKYEIQVLDIRRSIGQSILKAEEAGAHPRHGQEARGQS